ncbi:MAG: hypothetical protein IKU51_03245 [Clostridia bacterium]|nr:hypothetical protein [Clostridia bacterium]
MECQQKEKWWVVFDGVCTTPGAEGVPVYGVACFDDGWCWPDVDTDRAVAERLVQRLNRTQPEPCHYADMVLDFIEQEAGRIR